MNTVVDWKQTCDKLKGVGPKVAERFARLGIYTYQDLLFHLPLHYQDRTQVYPVGRLNQGEKALVELTVYHVEVVAARRKMLLCRCYDQSGWLTLCFFHYSNAQKRQFENNNQKLRCFGELKLGPYGREMIHPEYYWLNPNNPPSLPNTLTPVYPTTEGLGQYQWRRAINQVMSILADEEHGLALPEILPEDHRQRFQLWPLGRAVEFVHRPSKSADRRSLEAGLHPAQRRLAFEELMAHQLSFFKLRRQIQSEGAFSMTEGEPLMNQFFQLLPFELTSAQKRVIDEIKQDIAGSRPMLRLLQGDVGSGKTVVAAYALIKAVANDCQAAIMAPTEILAEQHYTNLSAWLDDLGISCEFFSGHLTAGERRKRLENIAMGQVQVIIGTHALFQEGVDYHRLGLLIIDEQHRFGVHQRLQLREKAVKQGHAPHQLIMTATPIPRTLAMSAYADLDYSVIDELPAGRQPVTTVVMPNDRREQVIERIRANCMQGKQAYWVCPLIEESEALQCQDAENIAQHLSHQLTELSVGLVHGRMDSAHKDEVMKQFACGDIDLLVATTVIEVGVDVPNASLMVIENPERLGLAQLHQLRGRIGRGQQASHCVLLYQHPLSNNGKQRLHVLRQTSDGFEIARRDMEIRGPGEVLGTRQAGALKFKIADIVRDEDMLQNAQMAAHELMESGYTQVDRLVRRWLGHCEQYGQV